MYLDVNVKRRVLVNAVLQKELISRLIKVLRQKAVLATFDRQGAQIRCH